MSRILWTSILAVWVVACGERRESAPPPAAATESPPAADGASHDVAPDNGVPAPLVFRVMREGGGGIDATINKIDAQNQPSVYAEVPGSGEVAMDKACNAGERFQAEPKVPAFHLGSPQECASRVEFMLFSTNATMYIRSRGDEATRLGDLLTAQSNYGLAADRLQYAKPEEARRLRVLSQVAAGRALGVTVPVQGAGGAERPTEEFKDRVRQFQKENGLKETGELDARTRESIGRMQLRNKEVVVPPAASGATTPVNPAAVAASQALVVTPQATTPAVEVRTTTAEMLALPASPQTVELIHANRAKAMRAREK